LQVSCAENHFTWARFPTPPAGMYHVHRPQVKLYASTYTAVQDKLHVSSMQSVRQQSMSLAYGSCCACIPQYITRVSIVGIHIPTSLQG
jgi:hypothetical protein